MRVLITFVALLISAASALAYDAPYKLRGFFSMDRKIQQALEDAGKCTLGSGIGDAMFCSVYFMTLATGYYHRGDYKNAAGNAQLAQDRLNRIAPGRPCKWFNQPFENSEVGVHANVIFAQPQSSYEIALKADPREAVRIGLEAFICEALQTYNYSDDGMWSNIGSKRLDRSAFLSFAESNYGAAGAAQVTTFLSEIAGPMSGPAKQVWAGFNSASPSEKATIAANGAELYRNAASYARELGLDRTFVEILQQTADYYDRETVNWTKLAQ